MMGWHCVAYCYECGYSANTKAAAYAIEWINGGMDIARLALYIAEWLSCMHLILFSIFTTLLVNASCD